LNGTCNSTHRNQAEEIFVIKGVEGHPRVEDERDVLKRFQDRTPYLRPLIDEIEGPSDPPTIVLKYLEDHLLNASVKKTLNRKELKYVSRRILDVARSKQVCIYVVEALLIAIYLENDLILVDIRKLSRSSTCLVRYSWSLSS
jgi:hypothetical protein